MKFPIITHLLCLIIGLGTINTSLADEYNASIPLLIAETAAQRNMPKTAIKHYIAVIQQSKDPKIAQIVTEYAIENKFYTEAIEAVKLWADIAPGDMQPQILAITLLIDKQPKQAKNYIKHVLKINTIDADQHLLISYQALSTENRKLLDQILQELVREQPKDIPTLVATAQITAQEENITLAIKLVNQALQLKSNVTSAIQLKAKLIRYKSDNDESAIQYLDKKVAEFPKDEALKLFYANALLDNNQVKLAIQHLNNLITSKKYNKEAKIMLGEIYLQQENYNQAKKILTQITDDQAYGDAAKFHLAQIAEKQNQIKTAIQQYAEIEEGVFHVPAVSQAVALLIENKEYREALNLIQNASPVTFLEQKQLLLTEVELLIELKEFEQAMKITDQVLALIPTDIDFLYLRSLIANALNHLQQTEQDLRKILSLAPEHAYALNALGFTIAKHPNRIKEAIPYIEQAMHLMPDNPAFMDSMGWVLFNMGKIKDSTEMLEKAYYLSNDSEIAAHLGEVLWASGNKVKAKKIFHKALKNTPDNDVLLDTLKRLDLKLGIIN